jgi:hypothetical protein
MLEKKFQMTNPKFQRSSKNQISIVLEICILAIGISLELGT